ncbi:hypothetical protein [Bradyrhizobium sp. Mp27]|uniref:hypothetical protein n=1 Tax=Bradyrhizobium sp. Mp27 TaxID=3042157 RepID=UPI00248BBFCC|nr:hypothetical protein [Bradyrhizobium sp. Mp27]MDI2074498.1 hypothetical protein [Bradyrhizobium sp. Mp27]
MRKKENPNKEKARQLAQQIANMTDEQKAQWLTRVPILTIEGRPISGKHQLLAAMQCQTATMVGGFQQRIAAGRVVREGESPRGSVKIPRVWSLETPPPDDRRQRR